MATVERAPSRQLSLQRMLELEKKYKLERLQGQQVSPASTPGPSVSHNSRPSLHARRSDSLTRHQQNYLMLKAVQRSVTVPSLSITIPPGDGDQKRGVAADRAADKEKQLADETAVEQLQKQVKFLAPEEDDMSDQSSICQSPSWEGYGQKKREKKLEAERKKKEKEQQDREARAAKRRLAARLSKPQPPSRQNSAQPNAAPFTNAERAKSDPLLTSRPMASLGAFAQSSGETAAGGSAAELPLYRPTSTFRHAAVSGTSDDNDAESFRGKQMDPDRQAAIEDAIAEQSQAMAGMAGMARQPMQKSRSMGSGESAVPASTSKDNRQPRDVHPPSASRTPLLRQASAIAHGRSNSLLSGASKMFRGKERSQSQQRLTHGNGSQESLQTASSGVERGRRSNSYVQAQRDQSHERAMSGLADGLAAQPAMPSKGSSHQGLSRRTSLAADASSVAKKLSSLKPGSGPKGHGRSHSTTDYFTFLEQPYSPPTLELLSPVGSLPASMRDKAANLGERSSAEESQPAEEAVEPAEPPASPAREVAMSRQFFFPTTSLQPVIWSASSSKAPSIASTSSAPSRKSRSIKDAFASLSMHRGSVPPTPNEAPRPKSPTFHFRPRMSPSSHSSPNTTEITSAPMALSPPLTTLQLPAKAARILGEYNDATTPQGRAGTSGNAPIKTTSIQTQPNSRVSEGSSSSSAYDDASPLPSPATTPDTSRPQSSKGAPATMESVPEPEADLGARQDDEKTVRESPDSSVGPTRTGTPRQETFKPLESKEMSEEEEWSRTALPLDLDIDAQSFVTSLSNLDNLDSIDEELTKVRAMAISPRAELLATHAARAKALGKKSQDLLASQEKPSGPLKAPSDPNLQKASKAATEAGLVFGLGPEAMIPPRSKKRDQTNWCPDTTPADPPSGDVKHDSTERLRANTELKSFSELQAQEQEKKAKPASQESKLARSRETTRRGMGKSQPTDAFDSAREDTHKPKRQHRRDKLREGAQENDSDSHIEHEKPVAADEVTAAVAGPQLKRIVTCNSVETTSSSASYSARSTIPTAPAPAAERKVSSAPESPRSTVFPEETSASLLSNPPGYDAALPTSAEAAAEVISHPRSPPAPPSGKTAANLSASPASDPATPAATSHSRTAPVSILKPASRSQSPPPASQNGNHRGHVLSALPKHMQLQAGMPSRAPTTVADQRMAPVAKMFVECCSCKFYHDMPSKLYECMAKPDAVVEDKLLGISGAITTMVKCPWCAHNMTTQCCAGYAAVVYLKERLH